MATLGSKYITKEMEWHANLTEREHLGRALMLAPHKLMDKIGTLFAAQNFYSNNQDENRQRDQQKVNTLRIFVLRVLLSKKTHKF